MSGTVPAFDSTTARERAEKVLSSAWFRPDALSTVARDLLSALDENAQLQSDLAGFRQTLLQADQKLHAALDENERLRAWGRQIHDALDGRPLPACPDDAPVRIKRLREALSLAETALDNIARLAEQNAEEPGWQTEVHRIACEGWRQAKDAPLGGKG